MEKRPKLDLPLTTTDKSIEFAGWILLALLWAITIANYTNLPNTIPTHYNFAGEADKFGSKWAIWTLPMIATALAIGMTILNKFPHKFNYLVTITNENALNQYTRATRFVRGLKLMTVLIFGLIIFRTIFLGN